MAVGLITATSTPDYPSTANPNGADTWNCQDWITWYNAMISGGYTVANATTTWQDWWNGQSELSYNYHFCQYQTDFYNFIQQNNITGVTNTVSSIVTGTDSVVSNLVGTAEAASGTASSILTWFSNNWGWVVLVVAIIALGIGIWWFWAKHIKKQS